MSGIDLADPELLEALRARAEANGEFEPYPGMTNFDYSVEDGLDEDLRAGKVGYHAGWNFNGVVFFEDGQFHEAVRQFHVLAGVVSAPDLEALMRDVNDRYGWD